MSEFLALREDLRDIEEFHRDGFTRIRQWYSTAEPSSREGVTGLTESPHTILRREATSYFDRALEFRKMPNANEYDELWKVDKFSWYRFYALAKAIGTEILLNAIVLKHDFEFYLEEMGSKTSPHYDRLRRRMKQIIEDDLNQEQMERIEVVLDILKTHRNNIVHLGFHRKLFNKHPPRILEVIAFLLSHFFSPNLDIVSRLKGRVVELDEMDTGLGYRPVKFPL